MIDIISFSYRKKPILRGVREFDCRPVRNPHAIAAHRSLDGREAAVRTYVLGDPKAQALVSDAVQIARQEEARNVNCNLGFGCVGGRHRSVAIAIMVYSTLHDAGLPVRLNHLALT